MALSMSIAIDPRSLVAPRPPDDDHDAEPPAPAAPPEPAIAPPEQPPVEDRIVRPAPPAVAEPGPRLGLFVVAAGVGWAGAAPAPNIGWLAGAGLRIGVVDLMLEGRLDRSAGASLGGGSVETSFRGGSFAPCLRWRWFAGCALGTLGQLSAEGKSLFVSRADDSLYALAGARVGIAVPITERVDVRAQMDALYALTPRPLRIDGQDAYTMPRISGGIGVGVGVRIF